MERPKEYANVIFDEIDIGATAELAITLTQNQIGLAVIVSGDVDALYVKELGAGDTRTEPRKTEAAGAEAIVSILQGTQPWNPLSVILHTNSAPRISGCMQYHRARSKHALRGSRVSICCFMRQLNNRPSMTWLTSTTWAWPPPTWRLDMRRSSPE